VQDAILGMFYGAAIGDSLGILTEFMKPSEAEFYYDEEREQCIFQPLPPPHPSAPTSPVCKLNICKSYLFFSVLWIRDPVLFDPWIRDEHPGSYF
jgi:hypothetical protein